jgi:hypothetical protein
MKTLKNIKYVALALTFFGSLYTGLSASSGDPCGGMWTGVVWIGGGTYSTTFDQTQTIYVQKSNGNAGPTGPNPCNGTEPPSLTACAQAGSEQDYSWQVTGGVDYGAFSESGEIGVKTTYTWGANCCATVSGWCQWGKAVAGLQHDEETIILTCSYDNSTVQGTDDRNYQAYCNVTGGAVAGCKATCP